MRGYIFLLFSLLENLKSDALVQAKEVTNQGAGGLLEERQMKLGASVTSFGF